MKKLNKLFSTLIAVLGVQMLSAQIDVTNQYLTNAGFDDNNSWITGNVAQATIKAAKGWTATFSGDTWWYGGAVNYGSSYTVNGVTPPTKNPDGNAEGGALGISAGWGCTVTYKQEVTLPAGVYTLKYKVYNANTGATQASNYIGFTSSAVTAYGKTANYTANTWVEEAVTFVLASQTTGHISVGMGAISGGSGANAKLFVDGVALAYKPFSDVTETNPVDLTSMVSNTKEAWVGATETPGYDGITMVAVYQGADWTGDALSQTINGLPAGIYKMELYCQAHSSWDADAAKEGATGYTYLCANEYKLDVPIRNADGATTKQLYTFDDMAITNGSLKISVVNEKKAANWISIYVKSLTFLGPDKTLSENAFNENYAVISNLDTNVPISAEFATEIQTLKSDFAGLSATELTQSQLDEANGRMQNVINEYDANIDAYVKLKKYIDMTKVFDETGIAPYEAKYNNRLFSLDEVEPVRQELNVMRFNAASLIFTNKVDVTGWTGTMGERDDQHWSGNIVSYKDANSWGDIAPDALTTQITLPKGNYVLKVAGRAHANAALTLKVLGQTITFHGKGDSGYGIDIDGKANFSSDGAYANNGVGRGWEWEFLKFSLDTEQTVTLEVNSGYNNNWQVWTSFGDITLWMDDATYVTVHGDAINEPLSTAKALVNTEPMGADENKALMDAITRAEDTISTPAELDGAIEALNNAISAANSWIPKYNEAKVTLVAALERFEADYNDAENGALNHMNKERWASAIDMAQAAALAKDVTDSYLGFETAAANLVAALDAASISANEYVALNKAIENTKIEGDNWGDQPFQKPESAKENINKTKAQAQIAYDEAIVDGDGIASIISSLQTAVDDIELNVPEEGQRFYIKVATKGHDQYANAVLATLSGTGDNNPTGYEFNAGNTAKAHLNQAFTFTQVVGNLYNISIERAEGTVYLTYGSVNGSSAEWSRSQIQATTDEAKKGEFKIVATNNNGIIKIYNTESGDYLDCQNNGSIFTDASISNEEFNLELAFESEVTLSLPATSWTTLILPFDAELPENIKAYSCGETAGDTLILEEVEDSIIKANTPYLISGEENEYTFFGYGLAEKDSYQNGLFIGTYVDYQTATNSHTYVLQENNSTVAFYLVDEDMQPIVEAYRCYMTYAKGDGARMFIFNCGNDDTGVEHTIPKMDNAELIIYDLKGRKVSSMEKDGIYIVNGVKVLIK